MELTCTRTALLAVLTPAARILDRKGAVPILANVALRATGGRLVVEATNMDMTIVDGLGAEVVTEGEVTLPGQLLLDLAKKYESDAPIKLATHATQTDTVVVSSGRSRAGLRTLPIADYPTMRHQTPSHIFDIGAREFRIVLSKCAFAMSTEETRYYLNGVHLHQDVKWLVGAATDGHRLARTRIPLPEGADGLPPIIIPSPTVNEFLKALDVDGEVRVEISDTYITVRSGERSVMSKLIDGTFPDYQRVIPQGNDKILRVCPKLFSTAIGRVATISSERGSGIDMKLESDLIAMSMRSPDMGEANDEIEAAYTDDPITIGFNSRYLTELLGEIEGPEVEIRMSDPGSPTLVLDVADTDTTRVLMPMRTRS